LKNCSFGIKTTITPTRALETKNNFKHVSTLLFIVKVKKTRKTKAKSNIKEDEGLEMGKILMHHNHQLYSWYKR